MFIISHIYSDKIEMFKMILSDGIIMLIFSH